MAYADMFLSLESQRAICSSAKGKTAAAGADDDINVPSFFSGNRINIGVAKCFACSG
jgi:hypothetical protein